MTVANDSTGNRNAVTRFLALKIILPSKQLIKQWETQLRKALED